jgi:hypothetical protein
LTTYFLWKAIAVLSDQTAVCWVLFALYAVFYHYTRCFHQCNNLNAWASCWTHGSVKYTCQVLKYKIFVWIKEHKCIKILKLRISHNITSILFTHPWVQHGDIALKFQQRLDFKRYTFLGQPVDVSISRMSCLNVCGKRARVGFQTMHVFFHLFMHVVYLEFLLVVTGRNYFRFFGGLKFCIFSLQNTEFL